MKLQSNLKISKKNVLVRVDLNLPRLGKKITDYSKIYLLKKTIKDLINIKYFSYLTLVGRMERLIIAIH